MHQLNWFTHPLICFPSCCAHTHTLSLNSRGQHTFPLSPPSLRLILSLFCVTPPPTLRNSRRQREKRKKVHRFFHLAWFLCFVCSFSVLLSPSSEGLKTQMRNGMWKFFTSGEKQNQQQHCRWERLRGLLCVNDLFFYKKKYKTTFPSAKLLSHFPAKICSQWYLVAFIFSNILMKMFSFGLFMWC